MKNEFINRLEAFDSTLKILDSEIHKSTWFNKDPLVFTDKVAAARTEVKKCHDIVQNQGADITGQRDRKEREALEAIAEADKVSSALYHYFTDLKREEAAAEVNILKSQWLRMRDQIFLSKARLIESKAGALTTGDESAAAARYGITAAAVAKLKKETDEYELFITAPADAIDQRAIFTAAARPQWRAAEGYFLALDDLIVQFGETEAGKALIAAYTKAREINDRSGGGGSTGGNTPPPGGTPPANPPKP